MSPEIKKSPDQPPSPDQLLPFGHEWLVPETSAVIGGTAVNPELSGPTPTRPSEDVTTKPGPWGEPSIGFGTDMPTGDITSLN